MTAGPSDGEEEDRGAREADYLSVVLHAVLQLASDDVSAVRHPRPGEYAAHLSEKLMDARAIRRWRRDTFRTLQSIDRRWRPGSPSFSCAMVMAAVAAIGTDPTALRELTGFSDGFIRRVLRRLRKSKLLTGQIMRIDWDHDDKFQGAVSVICDALVATGCVERRPDPKRSAAAQKPTRPKRSTRGTPTPRVQIPPGSIFTPKQIRGDRFYQWVGETADSQDIAGSDSKDR